MEELIKRVKELYGYDSDAALARGLGMSPQNFFYQKKTGRIKNSLLIHGIDKGVSKEWLLTGEIYTHVSMETMRSAQHTIDAGLAARGHNKPRQRSVWTHPTKLRVIKSNR